MRASQTPVASRKDAWIEIRSLEKETSDRHRPQKELRQTAGALCSGATGERTYYRVKVPNPPGSGKDELKARARR